MPLAISAACLPRQIGAPVVARGRAHQHAHRHLVCCGRPQWVWMSREVSPEVASTGHFRTFIRGSMIVAYPRLKLLFICNQEAFRRDSCTGTC